MITALMAVAGSLGAPLIVVVAHEYGVSTSTAQWTISLTYLTGAAAMPIVSWLAATKYRWWTTVTVVGLVCLGSLLGALDLGFGALLIGRCLQGLGLALMPVAIATARDQLEGPRQTRAIAILSVTNVAAGAIAFTLVGLLVDVGGPRLAYWFAAASTLAVLVLVAWTMPRHGPRHETRRADLIGTTLLAAGGVGLLLTLAQVDRWGWLSTGTIVTACASVMASAACVEWMARWSRNPFLDLKLIRARVPSAVYATSFTAGAGMYIMLPLVIVLAQTPTNTGWGLGLTVAASGLLIVPYALANLLGSSLSTIFGRLVRQHLWMPLGCVVYATAAAMLLVWHSHWWQLFTAMAVAGLGSGLSFAQMPGLLVAAVPPRETGPAIGFSMIVRLLGFSVGSALVGVVLSPSSQVSMPSVDTVHLALIVNTCWWLVTAAAALLMGFVYRPASPPAGEPPKCIASNDVSGQSKSASNVEPAAESRSAGARSMTCTHRP
ncbi:MFS transporter [Mycolicibacterium sp. P9-22]|nr:MFS transporter [Mycolicibacterium sp. P9-22]